MNMKNLAPLLILLLGFTLISNAQYKKDGTPDMRYSSNKALYGNYSSSQSSYYGNNSDVRYQSGYIRDNGLYVQPHYKTNSNSTNADNFSTRGNSNPYTNQSGTRARDYSTDAYNYGSGRSIETGPRGGQYYINSNGNKTYVPKRN
jgi:hypothetical protein